MVKGRTSNTHHTSKVRFTVLYSSIFWFRHTLNELLETFVVDVGGCPFWDLVARKIATELHAGEVRAQAVRRGLLSTGVSMRLWEDLKTKRMPDYLNRTRREGINE